MSPAMKRAIRTLLQGLAGALSTGGLNALFGGLEPAVLAALVVVITTFVSAIQNGLEDVGAVPALLKDT